MAELDLIRDWFAFNSHARRGYLESFKKLSKEELSRDRGASYPTLLNIFEHVLGAYYFWINKAMTSGNNLPQVGPFPTDTSENPDLTEIVNFEHQLQDIVKRFLDGLVEQDLDKTFTVRFDRDLIVSIRTMLWHLVEEELQHRGEMNALLWQIDVDAPVFDWIDWTNLK